MNIWEIPERFSKLKKFSNLRNSEKMENYEQRLIHLWGNRKYSNICAIGV